MILKNFGRTGLKRRRENRGHSVCSRHEEDDLRDGEDKENRDIL